MSKGKEIAGGFSYKCDNCEKEDGRPTMRWTQKDFDLCFDCLDLLSKEYKNI